MSKNYENLNIYCDESCHLKADNQSNIMAIAGLLCPKEHLNEITHEINRIKEKHGISKKTELKWTKISSYKKLAFQELAEMFFNKDYLQFRVVLIDKSELTSDTKYDEFYNKMCYLLLKYMLRPYSLHNLYLDKKDTKGRERVKILHQCLQRIKDYYDVETIKVKNVQTIQSHEVALMQVLDILMGAMVYNARKLNKVTAKLDIINYIKSKTGLSLEKTTPLSQHKFNILYFKKDMTNEEV